MGCDGSVNVDGWVVEAPPGQKSDIITKETELNQPQGVIENAWVELWTGDGGGLLHRQEPGRTMTKHGSFSVGWIGLYTRGMRYQIKAGAPGYEPVSKEVKLRVGGGDHALIQLAPVKKEEGQVLEP
jgi:hypothetical protein